MRSSLGSNGCDRYVWFDGDRGDRRAARAPTSTTGFRVSAQQRTPPCQQEVK